MPPWPNFPPWPCLDSQFPSNTELSLLCHNDESGRTLRPLRLRTTCSILLSGSKNIFSCIHLSTSSTLMHYRSAILARKPAEELGSCPHDMALTTVK